MLSNVRANACAPARPPTRSDYLGGACPFRRGDPPGACTPLFDTVFDRLAAALQTLTRKGRLSDADIDATACEIRIALLVEVDVAPPGNYWSGRTTH